LIKKKPDISNAELQKAFPSIRAATLKHYKTKFAEELGASAKKSKKMTKANVTNKAKPATKAKKVAAPKAKAVAKPKKAAAPKAKAVAKPKKAAVTKKKAIPAKKTIVTKTATKPELEKRLAAMEKQITKLLGEKAGKGGSVKASISAKAKDLEVNLLSFIKEKKKNLDELQNYVTNEVSSFLASIKSKKD
jgi:histone H1/5